MLVAFIPARGGSKGIPRKNLARLAGKPLIRYTFEAAAASQTVDEIFLSTDDEEIVEACAGFGLRTEYRRPAHLASDTATMRDTVLHGLKWLEESTGREVRELLLLQPTSPLRSADDIDGAVAQFRAAGCDTLVSVNRMAEHPCECVVSEPGGNDWRYLVAPPAQTRGRQDYPHQFYFINGAIYLARAKHLLGGGGFIAPGASALYEMPAARGIDIDTLTDLRVAAALLEAGGA